MYGWKRFQSQYCCLRIFPLYIKTIVIWNEATFLESTCLNTESQWKRFIWIESTFSIQFSHVINRFSLSKRRISANCNRKQRNAENKTKLCNKFEFTKIHELFTNHFDGMHLAQHIKSVTIPLIDNQLNESDIVEWLHWIYCDDVVMCFSIRINASATKISSHASTHCTKPTVSQWIDVVGKAQRKYSLIIYFVRYSTFVWACSTSVCAVWRWSHVIETTLIHIYWKWLTCFD